jgi:hypothetical protein
MYTPSVYFYVVAVRRRVVFVVDCHASAATAVAAGSEKAAAHRLGLSHSTVKHHLANARSKVGPETTAQLVWILGPRLPEPEGTAPRRPPTERPPPTERDT